MIENYHKAYVEVLEILKYMPKEDVDKIPKDMLDMFENKKDKNYKFVVNASDDFSKLKILDETEAIFVNFFRDYWATPEQKAKIIAKQNHDRKIIDEEKEEKYNLDDIFQKTKKIELNNQFVTESGKQENLPIEYKQTFFMKFVNFIKNLFKF